MSLSEQFQRLFGERVKARRRELHLTQVELSERLHISRTMLANIETGAQRTSVFLLARFVQALEVPTEKLVPGIAEAEARLKESRKVSLNAESPPPLLSDALKDLNVSVEVGSTLEKVLGEVQRRSDKTSTTPEGGKH